MVIRTNNSDGFVPLESVLKTSFHHVPIDTCEEGFSFYSSLPFADFKEQSISIICLNVVPSISYLDKTS